jgi:hypothetical protein
VIVHHVYFGQPKGGIGWKLLNKPGSLARAQGGSGSLAKMSRYTDALKWVALARQRRRAAIRARAQARTGEVTVAERYPLEDFFAMETPMDGPRLQPDGPLAGVEMAQYRRVPPPDLTLVLRADVDTLRGRKLDLTLKEHQAKVDAVDLLAPATDRVVIDAGRPYDEVLLAAKAALWKRLCEGR